MGSLVSRANAITPWNYRKDSRLRSHKYSCPSMCSSLYSCSGTAAHRIDCMGSWKWDRTIMPCVSPNQIARRREKTLRDQRQTLSEINSHCPHSTREMGHPVPPRPRLAVFPPRRRSLNDLKSAGFNNLDCSAGLNSVGYPDFLDFLSCPCVENRP